MTKCHRLYCQSERFKSRISRGGYGLPQGVDILVALGPTMRPPQAAQNADDEYSGRKTRQNPPFHSLHIPRCWTGEATQTAYGLGDYRQHCFGNSGIPRLRQMI
jgi:hypothetical protein